MGVTGIAISEEEKKELEHIKKRAEFVTKNIMGTNVFTTYDVHCVNTLIEIIEKQQKELNNLKEIEKSHKEENGLLRQELDMQIEHNKELEATLKQTQDSWFEDTQKLEQLKLNDKEKEKNKNTGKLVKNKIDGIIGVVLREWETGQIQVLEKIQPKVINTHDSWKTLEVIENE